MFDESELWLNCYPLDLHNHATEGTKKVDIHRLRKAHAKEVSRGIKADEPKKAKTAIICQLSDLQDNGLDEGDLWRRYCCTAVGV